MDVNRALHEVGDFGTFQKLVCLGFMTLVNFYIGIVYWNWLFILYQPDHWCSAIGHAKNVSVQELKTHECHLSTTGNSSPSIQAECPSGWTYDFSSSFPNVATQNNWVCSRSWHVYLAFSIFSAGAACGQFLSGFLVDCFGRKYPMCILWVVSLCGNIGIVISSNSYPWFLVSAFAAGAGLMPTNYYTLMYALEFVTTRHRSVVGCWWNVGWALMAVMEPWIAYGIHNWMWLVIAGAALVFPVLVSMSFLPESISWLLTKGKKEQSMAILHRIASINGKVIPPSHFNYIQVPEQRISTEKLENMWTVLKTGFMRKIVLITWLMGFLTEWCYTGNALAVSTLTTNRYLLYSIGGAAELPGLLFIYFALDAVGRKRSIVFLSLLGGSGAISLVFIPSNLPWEQLAMSLVVRFSFSVVWIVVFLYSEELYPTSVRGSCCGMQTTMVSLADITVPSVLALSNIEPRLPMGLLGMMSILLAILALFLPETTLQPTLHTIQEMKALHNHKCCSLALCQNS